MGNTGARPRIKVVDIFAGPGGLGEGFSSFIPAGDSINPFQVVLSAEKEQLAHKTLTLRAFYRRFSCPQEVPDEYYRIVRQEMTPEDLEGDLAEHWVAAGREALLLELGKESERLHMEIEARVRKDESWVLVGGPPCQAYSLVGRARNKGKLDYVAEDDKRHYLYREYLEILSRFSPPVFIMENVKGILTAKLNGKRIFREILNDLHNPRRALEKSEADVIYDIFPLSADATGGAYCPGEAETNLGRFLVKSEDLGVPQARHRVILLGIRRGVGLNLPTPLPSTARISVGQVVRDLPKVRSALSKDDSDAAWAAAVQRQQKKLLGILSARESLHDVAAAILETNFVEDMSTMSTKRPDKRSAIAHQDWYHDPRLGVTLNHSSRGHMPADLGRYLYCASFAKVRAGKSPTTKVEEFPKPLAANHKSWESGKFANRFRVQALGSPSVTVVSHIAKDGHYFIHPDPSQCRSFTVREAARAQTFPDNYFFVGGRTAQYVQVGNAVPPLLARKIAEVVWGCMAGARSDEK